MTKEALCKNINYVILTVDEVNILFARYLLVIYYNISGNKRSIISAKIKKKYLYKIRERTKSAKNII